MARIESWRAVPRCFSGTQARNSPGRLFSTSTSSRSGPTSTATWNQRAGLTRRSQARIPVHCCRFTDPGRAPPQDLTDRSLDHVTDRDPRLIGAECPCAASELAEAFDIHPNVVANICHGRTHQRVPAAEGREIRPMPRSRSTRSSVAVAGKPSGHAARILEAYRKTATEKPTTIKEVSIGDVRYRVDQDDNSTPAPTPAPAPEWICRECGFESHSREVAVEHIKASHPEELSKKQAEYEAKQPAPESEAPRPSPAPAKPIRKPEHAPRLVGDEYRCWVVWCAIRDRSEAVVQDHIDQVNAGTAEHRAPKLPSTESDWACSLYYSPRTGVCCSEAQYGSSAPPRSFPAWRRPEDPS